MWSKYTYLFKGNILFFSKKYSQPSPYTNLAGVLMEGDEGVIAWCRTGLIPQTFIQKFILVCSDGLKTGDRLSSDLFADMHIAVRKTFIFLDFHSVTEIIAKACQTHMTVYIYQNDFGVQFSPLFRKKCTSLHAMFVFNLCSRLKLPLACSQY